MAAIAALVSSAVAVPLGFRVLFSTCALGDDPVLKQQMEHEEDGGDTATVFTYHMHTISLWQASALFACCFCIPHALDPTDASALGVFLWVHVAFYQPIMHVWTRAAAAVEKAPRSPPWWVYASRALVLGWCGAFGLLLDILTLCLVDAMGGADDGSDKWLVLSEVFAVLLVVGCLVVCIFFCGHGLLPLLFFLYSTLALFLLLLISQRSLGVVSDNRMSLALGLLTGLSAIACCIDAVATWHTHWRLATLACAAMLSAVSITLACLVSGARQSESIGFFGAIDLLLSTGALLVTRRVSREYTHGWNQASTADVGQLEIRPRYSIGGPEDEQAAVEAIAGDSAAGV
jgi:hypothetical protein